MIHGAPEDESTEPEPVGPTDPKPLPPVAAGPTAPAQVKKKHLPVWQEALLLVGTALVLAIVVKTFFLQAFYIPSGSMESTLIKDDRILVQKVSYWAGDVDRGDIVVFDDPGGWLNEAQSEGPSNTVQRAFELVGLYPSGGHLVKRVIGVGGDEVSYCEGLTRVEVNGVLIDEPYLRDGGEGAQVPDGSDGCTTVTVPEDHLWVMGDNRANSADSRAHTGGSGGGFLDADQVVGKAWVKVWPWDRAGGVGEDEFDNDALDDAQGD